MDSKTIKYAVTGVAAAAALGAGYKYFTSAKKKEVPKKATKNVRVCVIGAGPSGCSMLRAFQSAKSKGEVVPEVVCFEKQSDWGGLWNYTWRTGVDENCQPVHGSMYCYLWSNGPKECLEFADYTFEEHFGKPIASYPPRAVLRDYIVGRLEKCGVRNQIEFNTTVRDVSYNEQTEEFTVTVFQKDEKHPQGREYSQVFDYVSCCSGHFSFPNMPSYPGFNNFHGRILHAHDFRDAEEFRGKDILIVGTSYSAEDIASQCYKYGVKSVTLSWRTAPMEWKWPENFSTVPLLTHVDGKTVHFKDGTSREVDAIIMCTGYQHNFPFLPDSLRLKTANRLWPNDLYKGVFFVNNPKMMYLGMQDQWYTFNMFDAQAWVARDVILGKIALPSKDKQLEENAAYRVKEEKAALGDYKDAIEFQSDYISDLLDLSDYIKFDLKKVNETFFEWEHHKMHNIMTFRDHALTSVMTGNKSPVHHTPWLKALDDSMESYLQTK